MVLSWYVVVTLILCLLCLGGVRVSHAKRVGSRTRQSASPKRQSRWREQARLTEQDLIGLRRGEELHGSKFVDAVEPMIAMQILPSADEFKPYSSDDTAPGSEEEYDDLLQYPFPDEFSDGSTLIVTVDGAITRVGPDGIKLWTAEAGGPMVTSYQNDQQSIPYAIIPQLDGKGMVHLQDLLKKKTFTTIPASVRALADQVHLLSHTLDGINYRKDESQLLVSLTFNVMRLCLNFIDI